MSSTDNIGTIMLIAGAVALMYLGYLALIIRASQKKLSTEHTIRYALGGLMVYVMATCIAWQCAVTETPKLELDLTELQNAEDPNSFLVERVDHFNGAINVHWGKSQFIRAMTIIYVFGGLVIMGQVLAKRYCRDDVSEQQSAK
ncbi:hypothetical protein Mal52_28410 [Symmachiella dynata]|uniref:Uncharacterized protein n=1 Tax=Symmachiella dynata TaxID=2527995 RepID=A0A517ZPL3_9PLAN|nr:hypothetical protein [Symmachiella dynata]QDU44360.1 hypothetical protein Mal52_28410 [Symmachiella dynata]